MEGGAGWEEEEEEAPEEHKSETGRGHAKAGLFVRFFFHFSAEGKVNQVQGYVQKSTATTHFKRPYFIAEIH